MVENAQKKQCTKCSYVKALDLFSVDQAKSFGRSSWCKQCQSEHKKNRYTDPSVRAAILARNKLPRNRQRQKLYRQSDAAKMIRRKSARTPSVRYSQFLSYATRNSFSVTISKEEYIDLIKRSCTYCGSDLIGTGCGLDRINNEDGYSMSNVNPCCTVCNSVRNRYFTVDEMLRLGAVIKEIKSARNVK